MTPYSYIYIKWDDGIERVVKFNEDNDNYYRESDKRDKTFGEGSNTASLITCLSDDPDWKEVTQEQANKIIKKWWGYDTK